MSTNRVSRCGMCRDVLVGRYLIYGEGKLKICHSCDQKVPHCQRCNLPVAGTLANGLCSDCETKAIFCDGCHKIISGTYVTYRERGVSLCQSCDGHLPRCKQCKVPATSYLNLDLCTNCLADTRWCRMCNRPITGSYWTLEEFPDEFFCESCDSGQRCWACFRPAGYRFKELSEGRTQCLLCNSTGVSDSQQVDEVLAGINEFIGRNFGMRLKRLPPVVLDSLDAVRKRARTSGVHQSEAVTGLCVNDGTGSTIYVPDGMPLNYFSCLLAHEVTHAWLNEQLAKADSMLEEGFCEWVSWKTALRYLDDPHQAHRIVNRKDLYGAGLNLVIDAEQQLGEIDVPMAVVRDNLRAANRSWYQRIQSRRS